MFGYVLVNKPELKIKEFDLYRSYYCGVCNSLKKRHGLAGRMTLNYDMTFLSMLLSDLYDKEDCDAMCRCIVRPVSKHKEKRNELSDYCADMCVYLAYYKAVDDWNDEHRLRSRFAMWILSGAAKKVRRAYPEKTNIIASKLELLKIVENAEKLPTDKVAGVFGEIMGETFSYRDDFWKEDLYKVGFYLGKFIYLLDAYEDIEKDIKSGAYNPFKEEFIKSKKEGTMDDFEDRVLRLLMLMISECTDAFEKLPLIENVEILRNILYSGVWVRFNNCKSGRKNGSI